MKNRGKILSIIANPSKTFTEEWKDAYNELCEYTWKYRWHDLRKSTNDLPPNGFYDTWSYWHEKYQNIRAFYNADKRKWLFHPENNTGKDWVEGLSIIAWKEIERFEE